MRIRNVELVNTPAEDRALCGWTGCRDATDKTVAAPARHHAIFQVRTGRVEAGVWVDRKMGLCDRHRGAFKDKYLPKGIKKEHRDGVLKAL